MWSSSVHLEPHQIVSFVFFVTAAWSAVVTLWISVCMCVIMEKMWFAARTTAPHKEFWVLRPGVCLSLDRYCQCYSITTTKDASRAILQACSWDDDEGRLRRCLLLGSVWPVGSCRSMSSSLDSGDPSLRIDILHYAYNKLAYLFLHPLVGWCSLRHRQ